MSYKFDTQYFGIGDRSIFLLRRRFPYREIRPDQIVRIELTKGTDVKRPVLSFVFGGILVLATVYLIFSVSDYDFMNLTRGQAKALGPLLTLEAFLLWLGGYSIYRAVPTHWVLKLSLKFGEAESISIREVIRNKSITNLLTSLKGAFGKEKIFVNRKLGG